MSEILRTTDYTIFKHADGNRPVDERRVMKIINSIQTVGWVTQPIIVNEKMEVIDGQGRLAALERLKMPVDYVIQKGATIRHAQMMNASNTSWNNRDYVKSYAEAGQKSYQRLLQMMTMYDVDVRTVLRLINKSTNAGVLRMLKTGEFFMSNEEFGRGLKRLPYFSAYMKAMKRFGGNANVKKKVVFYLVDHGGYPHQQIIDALTKCSPDDVICSTDERLIMSIEDVYNKFKREDKKIYLLADYRRK